MTSTKHLLLSALLLMIPPAAIGQAPNATQLSRAERFETAFTTVAAMPDGSVVTMRRVFRDAVQLFAELGIEAPATTQSGGNPPETPPPPAPSSVPGEVGRVTYQITSPGWLRTTTCSRPVNYSSDGTYTTGDWGLVSDSVSSTGSGGGSCHGTNTENCPESVN
jgi:hypothetical protein